MKVRVKPGQRVFHGTKIHKEGDIIHLSSEKEFSERAMVKVNPENNNGKKGK